eukprot:m.66448 g.66448  ORF g.66448 m.66448 type:complete len:405 (-) comp14055_c0_seq1:1924-3138(-)
MSSDGDIAHLIALTGLDSTQAKNLLEASGGNVEAAVNLHLGMQEQPGHSTSTPATMTADHGVTDGVRAPIAAKHDTLLGSTRPSYQRATRSIRSDPFRTFSQEQRHRPGASVSKRSYGKEDALSRLFEPPLDLLFEGDFTAARTAASRSKRHVLVNIQDPQNFDSQRLNRDVWKNDLVKEVIRGQFIFWQQYQETPAAAQYASWYPINEVPHVAIIDGETGERILILPPKTTAELFLERACTLGEPASSSHQSLSTPTQSTPLTEDEQMRLALAASLEHTNDVITIDDDDDDDGPSTSQGSTMKTDLDTQQPSSLKLKPEPAKGAADSCTIRFIMPDNSRLQRNFYLDETLAHVTHYLRHQADIPSKTFRLMHGRPPSDLQAKDSGLTLGELDMRNEVVRVDHD